MSNSLGQIDHVVLLMLENRSYDNMLGVYSGIEKTWCNQDDQGSSYCVWWQEGESFKTMTIPDPDPGELFTDMSWQVFQTQPPVPMGADPNMLGFVQNYLQQAKDPQKSGDPAPVAKDIMHLFEPDQVPVTAALADAFGHSDRWHCSAPCQTWPNRFFVHCATADGWVNNLPDPEWKVIERLPYNMPTIFTRIKEKLGFDKNFRIYFGDFPQSALLSELWDHADHFHPMSRLKKDVEHGKLQAYSFIEPRYFTSKLTGRLPNDQHPPHDVTLGEQLIAEVYNTLRCNEPLWQKTLLVVIWDEHGGCYDHWTGNLEPGGAPAPDDGRSPRPGQYGFTFNRYGVRVPALLVSPYIAPKSLHRAAGPLPFDHTSVIRTLFDRFVDPGGFLTQRDKNAPSLAPVLTLGPGNLNMGPASLPIPPFVPPVEEIEAFATAPLNDLQRSLLLAASLLPGAAKADGHLAALAAGSLDWTPPEQETSEEALPFIHQKITDFLGRDPEES